MMDISYKIHKYTIKLKNAKSLKEANKYQEKLKLYHRLNRFSGGDYESALKTIKTDIEDRLKYLQERINTISINKDLNLENIQNNIKEINNIIEQLKEVSSFNRDIATQMNEYAKTLESDFDKILDKIVDKETTLANDDKLKVITSEMDKIKTIKSSDYLATVELNNNFNLENILDTLLLSNDKNQIQNLIDALISLQLSPEQKKNIQDRIILIAKQLKNKKLLDTQLAEKLGTPFKIKFTNL